MLLGVDVILVGPLVVKALTAADTVSSRLLDLARKNLEKDRLPKSAMLHDTMMEYIK